MTNAHEVLLAEALDSLDPADGSWEAAELRVVLEDAIEQLPVDGPREPEVHQALRAAAQVVDGAS